MLASTFMDMVLGLDIHFEMVPMPAPVPTPIPNPFVGMVFDPAGLLTGQAMSITMALLTGTAPKGPVLINAMPATVCGTNAKNALGVPHILIPPGTAWTPMPKPPKPAIKGPPPPPGPPVAPEGDAISVFGSQTVSFMGASAVRMGDKSMSCGEPVRLPSSTVVAIPKGMPVMVGGPPGLSLADAAAALLKSKWVAGYLHDILSRMAPGRLRNLLSKAVCFLTGHPVDVATGRVLTDHLDWELPGSLPLKFERNYASSWANRAGPLGYGWSHSLDQAVWLERGKAVYLNSEGQELEFDTFDLPDHVIRPGQSVWEPISRLTLKALDGHRFEITGPDGVVHSFAPVDGATGARRGWARLVRKTSRDGATINLTYDVAGNLTWVKDAAGREIAFDHDSEGRLVAVKLPHPSEKAWQVHTRFAYDAFGDLISATDPLGHSWRFAYKQHLLVQETNRNGLSFYFAYDGFGEDAYCVRTWGDGGIYDHVIDYDKIGKVTCVTNSLGHTTTYKMNAVGCVVAVTDPQGATTKYAYDEKTLRKVKETDALGGETTWEYDRRGNSTKVTGPDGAEVTVAFNGDDQPVSAVDPVGGVWAWGYDGRGRLVGRIDPLHRRVQFGWRAEAAGGPERLIALTDPAGQETSLRYDGHGNVASMRTPDGAEIRWSYDLLGRCVSAIDAKGNLQRREHDALGRVTRVWEADGNVRELAYDPEGNVLHARDRHHDVRFAYQGMGRLKSRSEAGTTVGFAYDTEEQLLAITNEHGRVYSFDLDAAGRVEVERGFDGLRRDYVRDRMGRVEKVVRIGNRTTSYAYDAAGRVVAIQQDSGESEAFVYRADGEMVEAKNDAATVRLERDLLGRIVREVVGDDWVSSDFDALGMRARVRSSRGLDQKIARDAMGRVKKIRAAVTPPGGMPPETQQGSVVENVWEARIARDVLGQEIERHLPGGVQARWERDAVGRPLKREVWAAGQFRQAIQYTWEADDRLRMIIDATRGPTRYEHDALGNLTKAIYADGRVDLRMPDAVGNLFRRQDRADRTYGAAGQLLTSRDPDGTLTTYEYDDDGNLSRKVIQPAVEGAAARVWLYGWNAAGLLTKVTRPDGEDVTFTYDPLARRLSKTYRQRTTRWIWDGNLPLHEWVEAARARVAVQSTPVNDVRADEIAARHLAIQLNERPAQGPPADPRLSGTPEAPITWVFDPETFAPAAKLVGDAHYGIVTDHLGTPTAMYDAAGVEVWSAAIDTYGELRDLTGDRQACPFRFPGQYEDAETGLYYNRFRSYDPQSGQYISQDRIRIRGGLALHSYAGRPEVQIDPLGLSSCDVSTQRDEAYFWSGRTNGMGGDVLARQIAESRGGVTLEKLIEERAIKMPVWDENDPAVVAAWESISRQYAQGASGTVHVVLGEQLRPNNVWESREFDALKANPAVEKIVRIDPFSRLESILWAR